MANLQLIMSIAHSASSAVTGAHGLTTAAILASPGGMPTSGVAAVMTSPEWLAAGWEPEEHSDKNEEMNSAGIHERGKEPDVKGKHVPKLVKPYLWESDDAAASGEDAPTIIQLDGMCDAITNAGKATGVMRDDNADVGTIVKHTLGNLESLAAQER